MRFKIIDGLDFPTLKEFFKIQLDSEDKERFILDEEKSIYRRNEQIWITTEDLARRIMISDQ